MSHTSIASPTSPIQRRDNRSDARSYKREKDNSQKWSNGARLLAGVKAAKPSLDASDVTCPSEEQVARVRPAKAPSTWRGSDAKSHANITPKPTLSAYHTSSPAFRKVEALFDVSELSLNPLSQSILDLLPIHVNNSSTSIQTAILAANHPADAGVFYSFDRDSSPGKPIDLGGLVEQAEKKWKSDQTEKMVKDEYEILNENGDSVVISKRGRRSPKVKSVKAPVVQDDDDDGFEIIDRL